MLQISD